MYDRLTTSLWYPLEDGSFEAIGGKLRGKRIEFIEKPPVMKLGDWLRLYPGTQVLLGDQESIHTESMIPEKDIH